MAHQVVVGVGGEHVVLAHGVGTQLGGGAGVGEALELLRLQQRAVQVRALRSSRQTLPGCATKPREPHLAHLAALACSRNALGV